MPKKFHPLLDFVIIYFILMMNQGDQKKLTSLENKSQEENEGKSATPFLPAALSPFSRSQPQHLEAQGIEIDYSHIMIENKSFYKVTKESIFRSAITKQNRTKLKIWLAQQLAKNIYCRETYATASKYLDMYLSKQDKIQIDSFQALGLACFMLASKVVQSRMPAISYHVFDKDEILQFQKKISFLLQFKLLPLTYVGTAQILLNEWQTYISQNQIFFGIKYFQNSEESIRRVRSFMEILDCIDLVSESINREISSIILLVFFFENRINCMGSKHPETIEEALQMWQTEQGRGSYYKRVFTDFSTTLVEKCAIFSKVVDINYETLEFIYPFLSLRIKQVAHIPLNVSMYRPPFTIMTFNESAYGLAKRIMKKVE